MAYLATFKKFEKIDFQCFFKIIRLPSAFTKVYFSIIISPSYL